MVKQFHYFYKITNLLTQQFYYGIHSTDNINDNYMGSGTRLKIAYQKYGIENFTKEILKFFDTRKECADYEASVVTEQLINDKNCYNIIKGGEYYDTTNTVSCIDNEGNKIRVPIKEFLEKHYKTCTTGKKAVYDKKLNKNVLVDCNDNNDSINKGYTTYINIHTNEIKRLSNDEVTEEYKGITFNKITAKDKNGNFYCVNKFDERLKTKELLPLQTGRKQSEETKKKQKNTFKNIKHQQKEKNSQFGKIWIYLLNNDNTYTNITIKKEELSDYLAKGWQKGRRTKNYEYYVNIESKRNNMHWYHKIIDNKKITTRFLINDKRIIDEQWIKGR